MRFQTERCLSCGKPGKPDDAWEFFDFWFCDVDCYFVEIDKLLPKEYGMDKSPFDSKEMKDFGEEEYDGDDDSVRRRCDEIAARWHDIRNAWVEDAKGKIKKRLEAEATHLRAEQGEKERIAHEKERVVREKEEQERLAAEAEREQLEPRDIPPEIRLEHTLILAPSGQGKTQFLQNMILDDFLIDGKIDPNPPAYIFIDPKGLAIERLARRLLFARDYKDRVVIVDPLDHPALNLFQTMGRDPAQLISDFGYIFSTTKQKLTGKQTSCFSFCARLLFMLPNANLITLLDLLDDRTNKKSPNPVFQSVIPTLPPIARRFFENDFYAPNYTSTREEIKSRIYGVLENDHISAMLNANTRKLDIARCIRERKILFVNTRMVQLKESHQTLGRYIIALAQDAIQSRTERHPVYLVCDEFQEFADPVKTPQGLRLLREYGGGAVLAFQNMYCDELDDATRNAISTNTSIKYASTPEAQDLNYVARDLRCDSKWLSSIEKTNTHARFACFVRGMSPPLQHPFIVESQFGWIDKWPKMSDVDYKAMRARNKAALQDEKKIIVYADGHKVLMEQASKTHEGPSTKSEPSRVFPDPSAEADKPIPSQKDSDPNRPGKWKR
jgi:hypothetical protein